MADQEKLREYAAVIMAYLEDAHEKAMRIQSPDKTLSDMKVGFEDIRGDLHAVEATLTSAIMLISQLPEA
jgi:hypothetical protein